MKDIKARKYRIGKGRHYSRPWWPRIHFGIYKAIAIDVYVDDLVYDEGKIPMEDIQDINKLWGFSSGFHHKNSLRIGWYCEEGEVFFYAYLYKDGCRYVKRLGSARTGIAGFYLVYRGGGNYTLTSVMKETFNKEEVRVDQTYVQMNTKWGWGYMLKPYFGGNNTAPRDFEITIYERRE